MKVLDAKKITGSLTRTSKMPGLSYSLPAWECKPAANYVKLKAACALAATRLREIIQDTKLLKRRNMTDLIKFMILDGSRAWWRKS